MPSEWFVDASLPGLLRGAWSTYGKAVHSAMVEGGFDDIPRSGAYVVGAIARAGLPLSKIVAQLGFSKQAAGQLVDTLVVRGYLERAADPTDRRRLTVSLTPRGEAAAAVAREAIAAVDQTLTDRLGAGEVLDLRRALAAVMESGATAADS